MRESLGARRTLPPQHVKISNRFVVFHFHPHHHHLLPHSRVERVSSLSCRFRFPSCPLQYNNGRLRSFSRPPLGPTPFAVPMALHSYEGRSYFSRHRWARRATLASEPPCEDPTNTDPTISSIKASPTKSFGDASQVWPMSVSNAKAIW